MPDKYTARRALRRYARLRSSLYQASSPFTKLGVARAPRGRRIGLEDGIVEMIDLEAALSRLEPIERELLILVHVLSYNQTQAAQLLGISLRTVNRRVNHALEQYASQLEQ